jgi:glutaconate CoA-transferase subunit A
MPRAQFMPLEDAIGRYVPDGALVAFEGFSHLIPYAAAHEAIRQRKKDLVLIRMTPDVIYDQMVGMGLVRKIVFAYLGNPGVGLLRRVRDAVENAWPRAIELEEYSHAAMAAAYEAGAAGLPFAVLRGYLGTDLAGAAGNVRRIACPFTGETLAAVRAISPDVAVIHANRADRAGNVLIEGILGVQKEAALASRHVVVTVEEVVDRLGAGPNACILPAWTVDAIAVVPGGAHPSYTQGVYERDNAAFHDWDRISADRERFLAWMQAEVLARDPGIFAARVAALRARAVE